MTPNRSSRCTVLLIGGSLRRGSTHAAVLETAQRVAPAGTSTVLYERMADLPHVNTAIAGALAALARRVASRSG
jgi:NAD(P)H-dependent FMN reductase